MNIIIQNIEAWAREKVKENTPSHGGDIAQSQILSFESGRKYFLKTGSHNNRMFFTEANSLQELAKSKTIRIPRVMMVDDHFLLLEYIEQGQKSSLFYENFGRQFALMHRFTSPYFGLFEDNFIGHTQQINTMQDKPTTDWVQFYYEKRLLFQFRLPERQNLS